MIEYLVGQMANLDSNNYEHHYSLGEREGRVACGRAHRQINTIFTTLRILIENCILCYDFRFGVEATLSFNARDRSIRWPLSRSAKGGWLHHLGQHHWVYGFGLPSLSGSAMLPESSRDPSGHRYELNTLLSSLEKETAISQVHYLVSNWSIVLL